MHVAARGANTSIQMTLDYARILSSTISYGSAPPFDKVEETLALMGETSKILQLKSKAIISLNPLTRQYTLTRVGIQRERHRDRNRNRGNYISFHCCPTVTGRMTVISMCT
jgi:hypothetical protein